MNSELANKAYDILIRDCGASPLNRADFVHGVSDIERSNCGECTSSITTTKTEPANEIEWFYERTRLWLRW